MQFLSVNYSLNSTYQVESTAFEQVAKEAIAETPGVKAKEITVTISNNRVSFELSVEAGAKASYNDTFTTLTNNLNDKVFNLIDAKPENISISMEGK